MAAKVGRQVGVSLVQTIPRSLELQLGRLQLGCGGSKLLDRAKREHVTAPEAQQLVLGNVDVLPVLGQPLDPGLDPALDPRQP
jgi:hypothetical protein